MLVGLDKKGPLFSFEGVYLWQCNVFKLNNIEPGLETVWKLKVRCEHLGTDD